MTIYAGETIRISTTALNFDQETPLTEDDVSGAEVRIYNRDLTLLATETMLYSDDRVEWYYDWDTGGATPQSPGTYYAKITLTGSSIPFDTFEIKRFSLRRPRV